MKHSHEAKLRMFIFLTVPLIVSENSIPQIFAAISFEEVKRAETYKSCVEMDGGNTDETQVK